MWGELMMTTIKAVAEKDGMKYLAPKDDLRAPADSPKARASYTASEWRENWCCGSTSRCL